MRLRASCIVTFCDAPNFLISNSRQYAGQSFKREKCAPLQLTHEILVEVHASALCSFFHNFDMLSHFCRKMNRAQNDST